MNKRIAAVAAVLALSSTLAFAGGEGRGHGRHGKAGFGAKFAQELNLTEDQQRLIADIKKNTRAQYKDFFEKSRQTMQDARAARRANDTAKLDELKPALQAQREQMKQIRTAEKQQVMSVLNADQKAAWEKLKAERKNRGQRHDRGERKPRA